MIKMKKWTAIGIIMFVLLFIGLAALFYHVAVTYSGEVETSYDDDRYDPLDPTNPIFPHPPPFGILFYSNPYIAPRQ